MSYKAGFVGLIGQPNAGKSSIMNLFVNEKISIVTPKPQTTRRRMLGITNVEGGQIVFVDSPGVVKADRGLNHFLMKEAEDVLDGSDVLIAVLNVDEKEKDNLEKIIQLVSHSGKPWIAIINKIDLEDKRHRAQILADELKTSGIKVFMISARNMEGFDRKEIVDALLELLPSAPAPLYDVELFTPQTTRDIVSEIIREKCFEELHQEIPYNLAVRINKFDEERDDLIKIFAEIIVSKENHKAIVIGKGGENLKKIGMQSRKDIEKLTGTKVFLDLDVSFRKDWFDNKKIMQELGYVMERKD